MIVVDAGVVVDFLMGRQPALQGIAAALTGREQEALHAPELIEPEVLNALRGLVRRGHATVERAEIAVADLGRLRMVRYSHTPLRARIWALRDELTAYDAVYLALAEALGDESALLTGDAGLFARATASLGDARVRRIG